MAENLRGLYYILLESSNFVQQSNHKACILLCGTLYSYFMNMQRALSIFTTLPCKYFTCILSRIDNKTNFGSNFTACTSISRILTLTDVVTDTMRSLLRYLSAVGVCALPHRLCHAAQQCLRSLLASSSSSSRAHNSHAAALTQIRYS